MSVQTHVVAEDSRRADSLTPQISQRDKAARLLRAARLASINAGAAPEARAEAVDWALLALPESLAARRMKIDQLQRAGDNDHADALIAQSLLIRPDDAALLMRHAQRLLESSRVVDAEQVIRQALAVRPRHSGVLRAAGRIALAQHQMADAIDYFEQALAVAPFEHRSATARLLIEALLLDASSTGALKRAEEVIFQLDDPTARVVWLARIRRAQGRLFDALEMLERADRRDDLGPAPEELPIELIDVLEEIGDVLRLERRLRDVDDAQPLVLIRAGLAWLSWGAFETVLARLTPLADRPELARRALPILIAAAAMSNLSPAAERWMHRLRGESELQEQDREAMAAAWIRAIRGRLLAEQRSALVAGADPTFSQLQPMLRRAVHTLEAEMAALRDGDDTQAELHRHRATCLAALDRAA